ncbi:hypothetical protein [Aestuariivirga sp.]|uniref:hypothetical protein n=1 Tax=Aestuariivirga sp. TaxID=2650926 RepID=UPI00391D6BB9
MTWWLTVFFLLGDSWLPGDRFDGWSSRAYASRAMCEERQRFAEIQTARHPLPLEARWVCSPGRPAEELPEDGQIEVEWHSSPLLLAPSGAGCGEGLEVFTRRELSWIAEDAVGLRYRGDIAPPLIDELRRVLLEGPQRFNHVVLELDSCGGELRYVEQVVALLADIRGRMELTTRVMEGAVCASGCIPVFMQGEKRKASGASVWVFHGARGANTNVPDPAATLDYLELMTASGLSAEFRRSLEAENRIYRPGSFIFSGYEVFEMHRAGIITELLPPWREETPVLPPAPVPR